MRPSPCRHHPLVTSLVSFHSPHECNEWRKDDDTSVRSEVGAGRVTRRVVSRGRLGGSTSLTPAPYARRPRFIFSLRSSIRPLPCRHRPPSAPSLRGRQGAARANDRKEKTRDWQVIAWVVNSLRSGWCLMFPFPYASRLSLLTSLHPLREGNERGEHETRENEVSGPVSDGYGL